MKSCKLVLLLAFAVSLMASTVFAAGGDILGGGWIESAEDADSKANFGFNMHAADEDGDGICDLVGAGQGQGSQGRMGGGGRGRGQGMGRSAQGASSNS